mmetsp:Transcript_69027/g.135660  ORF Transcript_69027/g.135660 Transcript_69027/m.135660 type:complete len:233 (-) Transcript_69027:21-719(-)
MVMVVAVRLLLAGANEDEAADEGEDEDEAAAFLLSLLFLFWLSAMEARAKRMVHAPKLRPQVACTATGPIEPSSSCSRRRTITTRAAATATHTATRARVVRLWPDMFLAPSLSPSVFLNHVTAPTTWAKRKKPRYCRSSPRVAALPINDTHAMVRNVEPVHHHPSHSSTAVVISYRLALALPAPLLRSRWLSTAACIFIFFRRRFLPLRLKRIDARCQVQYLVGIFKPSTST